MQEADIDIYTLRQRLLAAQKTQRPLWPVTGPASAKRSWRRPKLPWAMLLTIASLFLSLKAALILEIGEHEYRAKLAGYADPSFGQKIGLMVMQPDIVSLRIHDMAYPYVVRQDCRDITKRLRGDAGQPLC